MARGLPSPGRTRTRLLGPGRRRPAPRRGGAGRFPSLRGWVQRGSLWSATSTARPQWCAPNGSGC